MVDILQLIIHVLNLSLCLCRSEFHYVTLRESEFQMVFARLFLRMLTISLSDILTKSMLKLKFDFEFKTCMYMV